LAGKESWGSGRFGVFKDLLAEGDKFRRIKERQYWQLIQARRAPQTLDSMTFIYLQRHGLSPMSEHPRQWLGFVGTARSEERACI